MKKALYWAFLMILVVMLLVVSQVALAKAKVNLSLVLITGHDPFKTVAENYMKENPNVIIDVQLIPTEQFKTIIQAKFAANDAPDIFPVFNEPQTYEYFSNGYIADLSKMTKIIRRMNPGADSPLRTEDGKLFALPVEVQLIYAYYNRDMFKASGLTIPKTWDQFLSVCKTLKEKGLVPIALGHKDSWVTQMIPYALSASLVHHKDPKFLKLAMQAKAKYADNPGWQDIMRKYKELITAGYIQDGSLSTSFEQALQMFATGKAGITVNGTWAMGTINDMKPQFAVGGFPVPPNAGDKPAASASINGGYTLSARSKNLNEARKFLEYMVSPKSLKIYLKDKGPSPFKDVQVDLSPAINEVVTLEKGMPMYNFDNWAMGVQDVFMRSIQELIAGTMTGAEALKAVDQATEKANNR